MLEAESVVPVCIEIESTAFDVETGGHQRVEGSCGYVLRYERILDSGGDQSDESMPVKLRDEVRRRPDRLFCQRGRSSSVESG